MAILEEMNNDEGERRLHSNLLHDDDDAEQRRWNGDPLPPPPFNDDDDDEQAPLGDEYQPVTLDPCLNDDGDDETHELKRKRRYDRMFDKCETSRDRDEAYIDDDYLDDVDDRTYKKRRLRQEYDDEERELMEAVDTDEQRQALRETKNWCWFCSWKRRHDDNDLGEPYKNMMRQITDKERENNMDRLVATLQNMYVVKIQPLMEPRPNGKPPRHLWKSMIREHIEFHMFSPIHTEIRQWHTMKRMMDEMTRTTLWVHPVTKERKIDVKKWKLWLQTQTAMNALAKDIERKKLNG